MMQTGTFTLSSKNLQILNSQRAIRNTNNYEPQNQCKSYRLIKLKDKQVRYYNLHCQNIDSFLSHAQWRLKTQKEVAHSIYLKVSQRIGKDKSISVEYYTQHLELMLKDMSKLITSEVIYLLVDTLKGYQILMDKFGKVTINSETIGLNSNGQCIVWLNRHLERHYPEYYSINKEYQVVISLLNLLKAKGQKVCQSVMSKIQSYVFRQKSNINQTLKYIETEMKPTYFRLPIHLKYLLKQNRIVHELQELQGQKINRNQHTKTKTELISLKTCTSNTLFSNRHKTSNYSHCKFDKKEAGKFIRRSNVQNLTETSWRNLKAKRNSASLERLRFFSKSSLKVSNVESQRNKFVKSNTKSYQNNISIINNINCTFGKPNPCKNTQRIDKNEYDVIKPLNKCSQTHTAASVPDIDRKKASRKSTKMFWQTHNSLFSENSKQQFKIIVTQEEQEQQSCQSSPDNKLMSSTQFNKLQSVKIRKFSENYQKKQEVFKINNWVNSIDGLLSQVDQINASIVQGSQTYHYLDDIKLQKLDKLKETLSKSRTSMQQ